MPNEPTDLLQRNLLALATHQPELCERLSWPVSGERFVCDDQGLWTYHWRRAPLAASLTPELASELLEACDAGPRGLIFGVGAGELVAAALARDASSRWIAWDRDPWILRSALGLHDWTAELRSGRLELALGPDLLDLCGLDQPRVEHPLLAQVYADERRLLEEGCGPLRALVCTGELFVDSFCDALRDEGFGILPLEARHLSMEELDLVARRFEPHLVASINFVPGLPEFCEERGLDYLCWEIDPALDAPRLDGAATRTRVHTYRRANVARFEEAGFEHVDYTPLAADPRRRRPLTLTLEEREHYGAQVSFVGASLLGNARELEARLPELLDAWRPGARPVAKPILAEVATAQREDFSTYRVPEALDQAAPGWRAACAERGWHDPADLVAELCAAEKRLNYVAELSEFGIEAWGDEGWRVAEAHGVRYRGPAKHGAELPRIYNASTINLDVGRLYQGDIVTMRVFDICACGGFVLAEHSEALAELFEVGLEVESYRTLEELREKVAHYLAHVDEARAIAARGRAAVLERHRIDGRVRAMIASLRPSLPH